MPTSKKSPKVAPVSIPVTLAAEPSANTNPVPTNVAAPPKGWVAPTRLGKKGRRPRNGLNVTAPDLAAELRKNAQALAQELGPKAVDPEQLASALDAAYGWTSAEQQVSTFHTYVRAQRGLTWDAALTLMAGLKLGVRYALSRDASFADRFPGVAKVFAKAPRAKSAATTAAAPAAPTRKAAPAPTTTATPPEPVQPTTPLA